ncbi:hypothetical protein TcasGA2_TC012206 [Tribolium castaneum]|uniref:Uncharacterized protein n=2 Tax=Tribolium castaneum TaxID=7070 RepID=D6X074_TRICA|nr:hypothetical protein TcasGA2_TC012206 [Tribolium castaneum]
MVRPSDGKIGKNNVPSDNQEEKSVALPAQKYWILGIVEYVPSAYNKLRNLSSPNIDTCYYKEKFNTMFRPSWGLAVVGTLPVVGNITNLASALHAYSNGDPWYGHQMVAQTLVGTYLDVMSGGLLTCGAVGEFGAVVALRIYGFNVVNQVLNPYVHRYVRSKEE